MTRSTNLLITCLFLYMEMQAVDSNTSTQPKLVLPYKIEYEDGIPNGFKYLSFLVEANSEPKVYGCSYLYTGDGIVVDNTCLRKIKNGKVKALNVQDTSNMTLRNSSYPQSEVVNGTYWYIYEVPISCWRTQEVYATIDDREYTALLRYQPDRRIKEKPTLKKAELNVTTQCISVEVEAIQKGACTDSEYQILIRQIIEAECALCKNWMPIRFSKFTIKGNSSDSTLTYEHCSNDLIRMPNTTWNDTSMDPVQYKKYGLYKVKVNYVSVFARVMIGDEFGPSSNEKKFTFGKKDAAENGGGNMLGAGKLILFIPFLMMLMHGYMW